MGILGHRAGTPTEWVLKGTTCCWRGVPGRAGEKATRAPCQIGTMSCCKFHVCLFVRSAQKIPDFRASVVELERKWRGWSMETEFQCRSKTAWDGLGEVMKLQSTREGNWVRVQIVNQGNSMAVSRKKSRATCNDGEYPAWRSFADAYYCGAWLLPFVGSDRACCRCSSLTLVFGSKWWLEQILE